MPSEGRQPGDTNRRIGGFLADPDIFVPGYRAQTEGRDTTVAAQHDRRPYESSSTSTTHPTRSSISSQSDSEISSQESDTVTSSSGQSDSETSSQASENTDASSVPSTPVTVRPPWHVRDTPTYNYVLKCGFEIVGCDVEFPPEDWELWISHTRSHFVGIPPPSKTVCIFCDGPNSTFENHNDPSRNWRSRMVHIGRHHMQHDRGVRPDYFVIKHLHRFGLLAEDAFKNAMKYSERQKHQSRCNGLVPFGHKTKEMEDKMRRKQEREQEQRYDLGKEGRLMRKERGRPRA